MQALHSLLALEEEFELESTAVKKKRKQMSSLCRKVKDIRKARDRALTKLIEDYLKRGGIDILKVREMRFATVRGADMDEEMLDDIRAFLLESAKRYCKLQKWEEEEDIQKIWQSEGDDR